MSSVSATMISLRPLLFFIVMCMPIGMSAAARAAGSIVWFHSDFPPLSIVNGPDKGRGAADQWGVFLQQQLPDFQHELIAANTLRIQEEMKHRDNACNYAFLKTAEREKLFLFSEPLASIQPSGLITLRSREKELAPFLNDRGELRLQALIATQKFRIAAAAGRSFGHVIDEALLAGHEDGKLVPFTTSDLFSSGLLQILNKQGIDALPGYAMELSWAAQRFNLPPDRFWFLPVEGQTDLLPVHVACSRSPIGEQIISQINELIRAGKLPEVASQAYRGWLPADVARHYDRQRKATGRHSQ
ncbi:TIGR02285 family protein [Uliginosibacterium sp. 31-16]|uniref:TIGR02285 family protein n=1 Tax=Uliginosibacterium sp. 31-16 TaxID=3068315 RepID=UPI00273F06A3|nr:TIGR02285 family protein [Uliginosibacterium sp. 31-16]MDP5240651.1 TIGR02285 family protein [Uliginosibacterium sp. 31-16]